MTRGTFVSALFVIALLSVDISLSVAYAKTTIYKVTKVSSGSTLRLRAWPSPKSRIKASMPHNARNITETGKKKMLGRTKWIEVRWGKNRGWVNSKYLKKTGVLLKTNKPKSATKKLQSAISRNKAPQKINKRKVSAHSSRNTRSKKSKTINPQLETPPQEFGGDRYDQRIEMRAAEDIKTSFSAAHNMVQRKLSCTGTSPQIWNMKMNVRGNMMNIAFEGKRSFKVPLRYNEWTSNNRARMSLGGSRGRNTIVDVNLERTNTCRVSSSRNRYPYEIKATINNQFYSGCCR